MTSTVTLPLSPSSSPRLPSPPPIPEVQIGPRSPTVGADFNNIPATTDDAKIADQSMRRIRPGTKAADMASGPPLVPLNELDSPFQLQEHIKALHYAVTKAERSSDTTLSLRLPITRETALGLCNPPAGVDKYLWLYELCRLLVRLSTNFFNELAKAGAPCSAHTCPEMRASEWQYLCAAHDPPKSCCAFDYSSHTLGWAEDTLTSPKHYPSRLTLGIESSGGPQQGIRQITNIFRRVYRIYAHAWFQHRKVFTDYEKKEGTYLFFKLVCDTYGLIQEENYTIPREAEGLETLAEESTTSASTALADTTIVKDTDIATTSTSNVSATTKRHKHTPSTGSAVTTIAEGDEDDHPPIIGVSRRTTGFIPERDHSMATNEHTGKDDDSETGLSEDSTETIVPSGDEGTFTTVTAGTDFEDGKQQIYIESYSSSPGKHVNRDAAKDDNVDMTSKDGE